MKLVPIRKTHLELLRQWRNTNRHFFLDSRHISKSTQLKWFQKYRKSSTEILYLVYLGKHPVGTIGMDFANSLKPEIDRIILGDMAYARQGIMSQAMRLLVKKHPAPLYHGVVLKNNPRVLRFDQKNGFTIIGEDDHCYYLEKLGPLHDHYIPLLQPSCSNKEISAVKKVLQSGWWGLGPVTQTLENEFAAFIGVPHAIALNSATAALHLAIHMLKRRYPKKTNIIVPALTFVSTAAVGLYENLEIRFADIDPTTLCLDPADVARKIDSKTLAIIPVHYAGHLANIRDMSCRRERLATQESGSVRPRTRVEPNDNAERLSDIPIIEDCAHAAGTHGAGLTGLMACWSFHPVKNMACGDGGMLTTSDLDLAQEARRLRWLGINADTWSRTSHSYNWEYDIPSLGFKYHLNDIQSAIALTQLRRLPMLNAKRAKLAARYTKKLQSLPLTLPPTSGSWHMYVCQIAAKLRNPFIDYLRDHHISVGVHYKPLHHYPLFKWTKPLPVTDKVWPTLIDLPLFPDLTLREQDYIINVIKSFFENNP